jgi:penicillin-binding protein 1A
MEGVIQRGTATVLRDLNRPMFGKTGTTSGPTNVWFVGGTPDIVGGVYLGFDQPRSLGGAAQGGRIAAPIYKQWAQTAFKDLPKTPFVAPDGIRWVRVDRASGKPVFGVFPTDNDPKPSVIWEAFQPQTEPRHSYRSGMGDPYSPNFQQQYQPQPDASQPGQQAPLLRPASRPPPVSRPAPAARPQPQPLPTQNAVQ